MMLYWETRLLLIKFNELTLINHCKGNNTTFQACIFFGELESRPFYWHGKQAACAFQRHLLLASKTNMDLYSTVFSE